jgi:hypothetical protein
MGRPGWRWRHLFLSLPPVEGEGEVVRWTRALQAEAMLRQRGTEPGPDTGGRVRRGSVYLSGAGAPVLAAPVLEAMSGVPGIPRARPWEPGGGPLDPSAPECTVEVSDPAAVERHADAWARSGVTRVALLGPAVSADVVRSLRGRSFAVDAALDPGLPGPRDHLRELLAAGITSLSLDEREGAGDPGPWLEVVGVLEGAGWVLSHLAQAHPEPHEPVHVRAIRRREPVLGLGPGAVTLRGSIRRWNLETPGSYLDAVEAGGSPRWKDEFLSPSARRMERIWLALGSRRGLRCPGSGEGVRRPPPPERLVERWAEAGWARVEGQRIRPTHRGWLHLDTLAVELAATLEKVRRDPNEEPSRGGRARRMPPFP